MDYRPEEVLNSLTPTIIGGINFQSGRIDGSAIFTQQNALVTPPWSSVQFGTGDFSIEFWLKLNSIENNINGFLSHDSFDGISPYNGWLFNICEACGSATGGTGNGGFGFSTRSIGIGQVVVDTHARTSTDVMLPLGSWHHVAGVRQNSLLRLYVDGILRAEQQEATPTDVSNSSPIVLGALNPIVIQRMAGELDEVSFYATALTAEDVAELASGGRKCRVTDDCEAEVQQLTNLNASLTGTVASLEQQITALTTQNLSLASQIQTIENQIITLQSTNASLLDALEECRNPQVLKTIGFISDPNLIVSGTGTTMQITNLFSVSARTPGFAPVGGSVVSYRATTQAGVSTAGFGVSVGNDSGTPNSRGIDGDGARGAYTEQLLFTLLTPYSRAWSGNFVLGLNRVSAPGNPAYSIEAYRSGVLVGTVSGEIPGVVNALLEVPFSFGGMEFDSIAIKNTHLTEDSFVVNALQVQVEVP